MEIEHGGQGLVLPLLPCPLTWSWISSVSCLFSTQMRPSRQQPDSRPVPDFVFSFPAPTCAVPDGRAEP